MERSTGVDPGIQFAVATIRLYFEDPYRRRFSGRLVETLPGRDRTGIVLDATCFYPLSGGQRPDRGSLNGKAVLDVEESEGGRILHWVESPVEETQVEGEIDWKTRFDHMQQHTGQHLLSRCFLERQAARTVSFHMGKGSCTIDLAIAELDPKVVREAEDLAVQIIHENRAVRAQMHARDELDGAGFRGRLPAGVEEIRIVEIEGFDRVPCCGTHVRSTGELGGLAVLGWEKVKQAIRVEFLVGDRVLEAFRTKHRVLKEAGELLTTGEDRIVDSIGKLTSEQRRLRRKVQDLERRSLDRRAAELSERAEDVGGVVLIREFEGGADPALQRDLIKKLTQAKGVIALLGSGTERTRWICSRGAGVAYPMNEFMADLLDPFGGKGGGSETLAQGGGPLPEQVSAVLDRAVILAQRESQS